VVENMERKKPVTQKNRTKGKKILDPGNRLKKWARCVVPYETSAYTPNASEMGPREKLQTYTVTRE